MKILHCIFNYQRKLCGSVSLTISYVSSTLIKNEPDNRVVHLMRPLFIWREITHFLYHSYLKWQVGKSLSNLSHQKLI